MKPMSFGCARSVNTRLHNRLAQEDEYHSYLQRVNKIAEKKVKVDRVNLYMTFLQRSKELAKVKKEGFERGRISLQNRHLLEKIVCNKSGKVQKSSKSYHLPVHQKREGQNKGINDQSTKIIKRLNKKHPSLKVSFVHKKSKKTFQSADFKDFKREQSKFPQIVKNKATDEYSL